MQRLIVVFVALIAASTAHARIGHVPGDAPTIQAGIDSATVGDVVAIAAGTYHETGLMMKAGIALRGAAGLTIEGPEGPVRVRDCVFDGNHDAAAAAAQITGAADVRFERCLFVRNHAETYGAVHLSRAIIAHNEVMLFTQASGHFGAIASSCCDFFANEGDDYRLAADSWCLPGHHPWDGCDDLVGAYGQGCPEVGCSGPVAVEPRSWSAVRGLFD